MLHELALRNMPRSIMFLAIAAGKLHVLCRGGPVVQILRGYPGGELIEVSSCMNSDDYIDNTIHTSQGTREWFARQPEIHILNWPAKSSDMNLIENVWADCELLAMKRYAIHWSNIQKVFEKLYGTSLTFSIICLILFQDVLSK